MLISRLLYKSVCNFASLSNQRFNMMMAGLFFIPMANAAPVSSTGLFEIDKGVLKKVEYHKLDYGFQGDISDKSIDIDVGFGEVGSIFLLLPPRKHVVTIELTTYVKDDKVYYPIVILLDKNHNWISVFEKGALKLRQRGLSNVSSTARIKISPFVKYLAITTRASLINDKLKYEKTESRPPLFPGSINEPEYSLYTIQDSAHFSAELRLDILIPEKTESQPVRRQTGLLIELGMAFGNESIALPPNDKSYKVGSGAFYGFGYAWHSKKYHPLTYRVSAGLRDQGGDGSKESVYAQLLALKEFARFNAGIGIYASLQNQIRAYDQSRIDINNAFGPQLAAEWRINSYLNVSLKYVWIHYQDNNGGGFNGSQFMLQTQFFN